MSLASLFHYLMLNMFRMLIHPSSGACDSIWCVISWIVLLWFDACWCYVVVWLVWCGVLSGCRLKHCIIVYVPRKLQRGYNVNRRSSLWECDKEKVSRRFLFLRLYSMVLNYKYRFNLKNPFFWCRTQRPVPQERELQPSLSGNLNTSIIFNL